MTVSYGCLGLYPSSEELVQSQWLHPVTEELDFKAPWTALHNAVHLAFEVGSKSEIAIETFCLHKPRRQRPSVRFSSTVQVHMEFEEANLSVFYTHG